MRSDLRLARPLELETLEDRTVLSITFQFDYRYDVNGFFSQQSRRDVLQAAADALTSRIGDTLSAITPSGSNTWTASFYNPTTGSVTSLSNLSIVADKVLIFVGSRNFTGTQIAEGGFGGWSSSGSAAWNNLVKARGQSGALLSSPTDFGPWGGSLAFDSSGTDWFFGTTTANFGSGQVDFYSTAMHELGHVLGIGTTGSWTRQISGSNFTGPNAVAKYGGPVPVQSGGGHFAEGVSYNGQEVAMDPTINYGQRKVFTELDYAALQDIGWQISAPVNQAPSASAGGPYSIAEGQSLTLSAAGSSDPNGDSLTYSWDVNGDGTFGDATGLNPTLTWTQLVNLGITDGPFSTTNLRVRVSDGQATTDSAATSLSVANAPPTVSLGIPALGLRSGGLNGNVVRGEAGVYTLTASDASAADQSAGFTFSIDWNGDGIVDQTVVGNSGATVSHVFTDAGSANVLVTAADRNGGVSQTIQTAVRIADWDLRLDPSDSAKTNLLWGGTNGQDVFGFLPGGTILIQALNNQFYLTPQIVSTGGFNGKLIVYAQGSSDLIYGDAMTQGAVLFGGAGDDILVGGRGADSIEGGDGRDVLFGGTLDTDASDTIVGGAGDDVLIGNYGADRMYGGAGQDLLISGRLYYSNLPAAVFSLQSEWLSGRSYAERTANLLGFGTGPRFNGDVFLTPGVTVLNDGGVDQVFGEGDQDWFLVDLSLDVVGDLSVGETTTAL